MKIESCDKDGFLVFASATWFVRGWVPKSGRLHVFWSAVRGWRRPSLSLARAGVLRTVTAKGRLQLAGAREDAVHAAPGRKGETATA